MRMLRFSANLGFLWADQSLADGIRLAAKAGFDAVECHWPYNEPAAEVRSALVDTGLEMLCINTSAGDVSVGEFGLSALPGRERQARNSIDAAVEYAASINAKNIHLMAGKVSQPDGHKVFESNIVYACEQAELAGCGILIEPINHHDVPGYFLNSTNLAREILRRLDFQNLHMMFDCYHVAKMGLDIMTEFSESLSFIGHIQFAGLPDRGPPHNSSVDYMKIFSEIDHKGYANPVGAEYRPAGTTEESLVWLDRYKTSNSLLSKN